MLCVVLFGMPSCRPISATDSRGAAAEKRFMMRMAFETLLIMASVRRCALQGELAREMAGGDMTRRHFGERWRRRRADRLGVAAARMEGTAGRRRRSARDLALEDDGFVLRGRIRPRDRGQQSLRIRMPWTCEEGFGRREFDDATDIHHGEPIGDVLDDAEIVRDEEIADTEILLQILQQVEDLRLDRDVERGYRLVGDDKERVGHKSAGDADALPLAAAEGVRITVEVRRPRDRPFPPCPSRAPRAPGAARLAPAEARR